MDLSMLKTFITVIACFTFIINTNIIRAKGKYNNSLKKDMDKLRGIERDTSVSKIDGLISILSLSWIITICLDLF